MESGNMQRSTVHQYGTMHEGGSEQAVVERSNSSKAFLYSLVVLLEVVGVTSIVLVCVWMVKYLHGFAWTGDGKIFNWHPVFMTVGLIFLYGNGMIVYRVFHRSDKFIVKLVHAGVNALSFIFSVLGLYAVFTFHNLFHFPNVYSLHSWIGIMTVALYGCQLLFGFLGFLYPKLGDVNRARYLRVHTYFGFIIFIFAVVAAISGITEKLLFTIKPIYPTFPPVGVLANCFGIFIMLFAMIVVFILLNSDWKRTA